MLYMLGIATRINKRNMAFATEIFIIIAMAYFVPCYVFTSLSRWLKDRLARRKAT